MGRHYLPRSDRHPQRLRRLRRSWPAVGTTGVNAPNIGEPFKVSTGIWEFEVHTNAPTAAQTYTVTIKQAVIATGAPLANIVVTAAGAANDTKAQLATKLAAALEAHAALTSTATGSFVTFALADSNNKITTASVTGAPTAAIVPQTVEAPVPVAGMANRGTTMVGGRMVPPPPPAAEDEAKIDPKKARTRNR